ncbi:SDR family NAD(P)-dependent oxidoreductase [Phytomonospora endophytica]|uniref:Polyketide synthase PksN n=1 Tax=Phytomonospora endophytica TaxID=714109 RepID=A0A841G1B5_9ACTN|nr:SDR family NAD(P)-dependent oxidoreductase [Phytomonospora endophytica]MBB6039542.1 polyketide synthase PksN [Phytomonospora endophytica]GIG70506.1 hypothetical protein Pen01_68010 [Phytomonospora endophytica]
MDGVNLDRLLAEMAGDGFDLPEAEPDPREQGVAVIGMSARVGPTASPEEFWNALKGGADLIGGFPERRRADAGELKAAAAGEPLGQALPYGYLDHIDLFDPERFAIAPGEAALMDPHQRLFLAAAMTSIEDAGYGGDALRGTRTGVYLASGASPGLYLAGHRPTDPAAAGMAAAGTAHAVAASRISHFLDLRGPALLVDTACSSSLAAVITACRDLRDGVVDTAVAGGVRVTLIPPEHAEHRFGIEAPSGRTRAFSGEAEGTGGGEGVIALVLKPLAAAIADGDHVHGVIRGWAMNQDGASAGITAPNAAAQAEVIRDAWRDANVDPLSVSYIEAHGTATALGDPVEITGLTEAFAAYTDRRQFCALGSVKTNVGHLDAAAGITGLLKTLLMLKHRSIPPSLHFSTPNPRIDFADSPVHPSDRLQDWTGPFPLRAGVSSFGISGTNCHVLVEEAPAPAERHTHPREEILVLSARTATELHASIGDLHRHLAAHPDLDLADVCFTAGTGRGTYEHRVCFTAATRTELTERIDAHLTGKAHDDVHTGSVRVVADATGLGEGYIDADTCQRLSDEAAKTCRDAAPRTKRRTAVHDLARLYTTGARVPWARLYEGRDLRRVPLPAYDGSPRRIWRPAPTAVAAPPAPKLHPLVHRHTVEGRGLDVFESELSAPTCFELGEHVINGRHVLVGTALVEMAQFIAARVLGRPPVLTNLHYRDPLVTDGEQTRRLQCVATGTSESLTLEFRSRLADAPEWTEHCRVDATPAPGGPAPADIDLAALLSRCEPVLEAVSYHREMVQTEGRLWRSSRELYFGDGGETLLRYEADPATSAAKGAYTLFPPILDSGVNLGLLREKEPFLPLAFERAVFGRGMPDAGYCLIVPTDRREQSGVRTFDATFTDVDGAVTGTVTGYSVGRVPDPATFLAGSPARLHEITWKPATDTGTPVSDADATVVLTDGRHPLAEHLAARGAAVRSLTEAAADENWAEQIARTGVRRIVHIVAAAEPTADPAALPDEALRPVFDLIRALALRSLPEPVDYAIVTRDGQCVLGEDVPDPAARAVAAAATCLDAEYANIRLRVIDTDDAAPADVAAALLGPRRRTVVAVRDGRVFQPAVTALPATTAPSVFAVLDGTVVVTGGTGGMGLALAAHLTAANPGVRVALLNRRHDDRDTSTLPAEIASVLDALGDARGRVGLWRADVTDGPDLEARLDEIRAAHGPITGVVHAAGLPGDGFAITKTWEEFARVLAPKTAGVRLLDRATRADPLRFFALCSSMTAVLGAPGQSDYAAANAYLDAYAARMRAEGRPALAVGWTGWRDSGMAWRHGITGTGQLTAFVGDTEGCALLDEALTAAGAHVLAGAFVGEEVRRRRAEIGELIDLPGAAEAATGTAPPATETVDFDDLTVRGLPARQLTGVQRAVTVAWCTTLDTREVDVHDLFFESGGNSLLASRLQLELDRRFPGVVNIADIFAYPTVVQLSDHVTAKTAPPAPVAARRPAPAASSLSDLLDDFLAGKVSIQEVVDS